jgi:peptidoglycan/LPS O-acetylase OafA/YrhL
MAPEAVATVRRRAPPSPGRCPSRRRGIAGGLSSAQVLPALAGAILGIAGGLALFATLGGDETANPPLWQLLAVVPVTILVVAALTTIPARLGARRPAAEILQSELA